MTSTLLRKLKIYLRLLGSAHPAGRAIADPAERQRTDSGPQTALRL